MKKKVSLCIERLYPYILALVFCAVLYIKEFDFSDNGNMNSFIEGVVTMEAIVIGLIGAIIPVILSIKGESKLIQYVFKNDKHGLFRKYLTITIGCGLLSVAFSLAMYIRDEYSGMIRMIIYNIWLYLIILFLLLTYRSMKYMIFIIFNPDIDDVETEQAMKLDEADKLQLRNRHTKRKEK